MILLLAGTSDSKLLAKKLVNVGFPIIATTVTENGAEQLRMSGVSVVVKRLSEEQFPSFIREHNVTLIIDASHPYAEMVSKNAISAAKRVKIPYIRYERNSIDYVTNTNLVTVVSNYHEAASLAEKKRGVVLLTTGSKTLPIFAERLNFNPDVRLLIRCLPNEENLKLCKELLIPQKNIIAIQGPFSKDFNKALLLQYNVSLMITKESGKEGSFEEKLQSAIQLGIETIVVERPAILYETVFSNFEDLICYIKQTQGE